MFPIPLCTLSALQMEMRWKSEWQVSLRHKSNDKWSKYSEVSNYFGSPGVTMMMMMMMMMMVVVVVTNLRETGCERVE